MKNLIYVLCFFFFSPAVHAMDLYNFRNLGFSPDGLFFAYANTTVQDGSGFPHATVYVVNVPNNVVVRKASLTVKDDSSYEESEALRRILPAVDLDSYQIYPGTNLGKEPTLTLTSGREGSFVVRDQNYSLNLTENDAGNAERKSSCKDAGHGSKTITLTLSYAQTRVVLENERYQPLARYCSYAYKIEKILTHGKNLVVVLSYQSPGFEGPDTNYRVVTGNLP